MNARATMFALLALTAAFIACTASSSSSPTSSASSTLPCAVDDVLARRCRECHGSPTRYGAPMPLVTQADLTAASRSNPSLRVFELVAKRIHDPAQRMPQAPNPPLSTGDLKVLDDWIASGASQGDACNNATSDAGETVAPTTVDPKLSCTPNVHVRPQTPFRLPAGVRDELVCYGFETSPSAKRHIIGLAPAVGAGRHLHHVTLLQSDSAVSPIPALCTPESMTTMRSLYGWAPGAHGLELPPEAGLPDEPGSHYVIQLHYVNPNDEVTEDDASGFDLCTTSELRPNDADVMAFGTMQITIPARSSEWVRDCSIPVPADGATTHLFAAFPHMHALGTSIRTVVRAGGSGDPIDLGTVAQWSLANQAWLPIDYTLSPGDVVETRCTWANPNDYGVGYGPTASDEMCFSYVMYFPKITASTWSWSLPALYSTCL